MAKHWMYHQKHSPKLFLTADLPAAEKAGWVDTPEKLKAPEKARLETPRVDERGPEAFAGLSDDELARKYEQVRGKVPHPMMKRENIVDSILMAQQK